MKILVLVKQVPDSGEARALDAETGLLDREGSEAVTDEICERAVECALQVKDADDSAEVVVVTVGRPEAEKTLRRMLAMGADRGMHIVDDALPGSDMMQTAKTIAAAVGREEFDVVVAGDWSTDGRGGMVPSMVAELTGVPVLPDLESVEITEGQVRGWLRTETSDVTLQAPTPAVVSVTERSADPRFPSFKGIMAAKKKPLETLSLADLGTQSGPAYAPVRSVMVSAQAAPPKQAGTKVVDDGTAAAQLAGFLESKHLL